ncbi:CaiB/BaiF CoA transferase family protein [Rummeliibacillus sp. NPDC094406]|uniref:CaiB/BaiF CoA transferase family protein n=1 Tax=Rummeliibacillus sp. NPDC094406 TaxID=3364511 RepID=UPI00382B375D
MMKQPLEDVRILDLSRVYAAPAGSMILADLGAEVIRVEHPNGMDSTRDWGPFTNDQSTYYLCANRNKKSIILNLKEENDRQVFKELLLDADIILENFKTGDMERMGLGYEDCKKLNPRIIYCSVTGFGHTGPLATEPGFDPVIQAMSGLMDVTGAIDGDPTKVGIPIADILTSHYVAISILAAIRMRDITNEGQCIDLSLLDVQVSNLANVASSYLNGGTISKRLGNSHNNVAPYQVFQCSDGPLMVCVGNDRQFEKFCKMIDREQWAQDERFKTNTKRKENERELVEKIAEILLQKTRDEWIEQLQNFKIPGGRVNTIAEALEQPQLIARDMIGEIEHPQYGKVKFIKNPMQFSGLNIDYKLAPPILGEHTNQFFHIAADSKNG